MYTDEDTVQLNKEFEPYRHCCEKHNGMFIQQLTMQEHSGLWKVVLEKPFSLKIRKQR